MLQVVVLAVLVPVPELKGDGPPSVVGTISGLVNLRRRRGGPVAQQLVVRSCADQQQPIGTQHTAHLGQGRAHIVLGQQVGKRVVSADRNVESAATKRKLPHIGGCNPQPEVPALRLPTGASGGAGAEISTGDTVPPHRQPDRLRTDAAGAVEHFTAVVADQSVESIPLPTHAGVPVRVDQVVAVGQLVVEARHRCLGHGQRLPLPILPGRRVHRPVHVPPMR